MTALDEQVGGSHYKEFAIQPVEFIYKNNIGFIEGNIIKYICRYKSKGGIDDLKKVKHYAELLIDLSTNNKKEFHQALKESTRDFNKIINETICSLYY